MKLLNLSKYIFLITILSNFYTNLLSEDAVDIWKKTKKLDNQENVQQDEIKETDSIFSKIKKNNEVQIKQEISDQFEQTKLHGIYDPDDSDFTLYMWSRTTNNNFSNIIDRINKIKLSETAENIFIKTLFSNSYYPSGLSQEEFVNIKINWMIKNQKEELIEQFLEKNSNFSNRGKLIQYLVDKNISRANIVKACENMSFISQNIEDIYLDKFNIYCLIFNNKKNQAQLLYDILKEQGNSDSFFDDKINFLLGITKKQTIKFMIIIYLIFIYLAQQ